MTRLIDADALEKNLSNDLPYKSSVKRVLIQAPTVEAYSAEAVKQIMWERDMAIQQLNDYGVQLGEKADLQSVVRCKDCVCSRELHEKEKWLYVEDTLMCGFFDRAVPNDGFCDNAERRGDLLWQ